MHLSYRVQRAVHVLRAEKRGASTHREQRWDVYVLLNQSIGSGVQRHPSSSIGAFRRRDGVQEAGERMRRRHLRIQFHGAFLGHKKSSVGLSLPSARLMASAAGVSQLKSNRPHTRRLRKNPDDALQKKVSLASCLIRKIRPQHHVFGILWCLASAISPPRSHMQSWSRS